MDSRIQSFRIGLIIAIGILVIRLVHLQLIHGAKYRRLAESNRVRLMPEQAPRGLIVDRRGRVLASNRTIFRLAVIPQEVEDMESIFIYVSQIVGIPTEDIKQTLRRDRGVAFAPANLVKSIPKPIALRIAEEQWRFPGLLVNQDTIRRYPMGSATSHVLGYLSQPTPNEVPRLKYYGVEPKHLIGRAGIEKQLDSALRGRPGGHMVEVNNRGRQVRVLGEKPALSGERVVLTIDAQLQSLIEESLGKQPGAGVVIDPNTGDILAMVSVPGFDPEVFVTQDSYSIRKILRDKRSPLMNRATQGLYQPGSTAKIVVAVAALAEGIISPETTVICNGAVQIGDRKFHCWNRDGHGPMKLIDAIRESCNVYFMRVARWLGADRLNSAFKEVGFGRRSGFPLIENGGHLPQRHLLLRQG